VPGGNHSVRISATGRGTGAVIAEVYDATPPDGFTRTTPRLINVSVLKPLGAGFTVGLVVGGSGARRVLVRAVGPTLGTAFGVSGAAVDLRFTVHAGTAVIAGNDNWGGSAALKAAFAATGAFGLPDASRDAAAVLSLPPGNYTVAVSSASGAGGLALAEVYELNNMLVSVDDSPAALALPPWFLATRVVLHTRLTLNAWFTRPLFNEAEGHIAAMGARAYSRHIKSGDEGAWWPSAVGAVDPRIGGRDLAAEILGRAHAASLRLNVYHRHMEDAWAAAHHPDWVCVDPKGAALTTNRGTYLCLNSPYADYFIRRQGELIARGADGFYFDERHMPEEGCWCTWCRARFTTETGLVHPSARTWSDPAYRQLVAFNHRTVERGLGRYIAAARGVSPPMPILVSIGGVPVLNNPALTTDLARLAPSPKSEYEMAVRRGQNTWFTRNRSVPPPAWDAQLAFSWSLVRDAAQGRPGHYWVNGTRSAEERLAAAAALLTYGHVANLDVVESTIPNAGYTPALQLGDKVGPLIAHTRPVRWAALLWSERSRNDLYADTDLTPLYRKLLIPSWQSYQALCRMRAPLGIVTDTQLERGELTGYRLLILPRDDGLTTGQRAVLADFAERGGAIVRLKEDARWYTSAATQEAIRAEFAAEALAVAGPPPFSMTGGSPGVHGVAVKEPRDDRRVIVCVTNEFTWLGHMQSHRLDATVVDDGLPGRPPPRAAGVSFFLRGPAPSTVTEQLTGAGLTATPEADGVRVALPDFEFMAVIVLEYP
jgi:hypothetical protein